MTMAESNGPGPGQGPPFLPAFSSNAVPTRPSSAPGGATGAASAGALGGAKAQPVAPLQRGPPHPAVQNGGLGPAAPSAGAPDTQPGPALAYGAGAGSARQAPPSAPGQPRRPQLPQNGPGPRPNFGAATSAPPQQLLQQFRLANGPAAGTQAGLQRGPAQPPGSLQQQQRPPGPAFATPSSNPAVRPPMTSASQPPQPPHVVPSSTGALPLPAAAPRPAFPAASRPLASPSSIGSAPPQRQPSAFAQPSSTSQAAGLRGAIPPPTQPATARPLNGVPVHPSAQPSSAPQLQLPPSSRPPPFGWPLASPPSGPISQQQQPPQVQPGGFGQPLRQPPPGGLHPPPGTFPPASPGGMRPPMITIGSNPASPSAPSQPRPHQPLYPQPSQQQHPSQQQYSQQQQHQPGQMPPMPDRPPAFAAPPTFGRPFGFAPRPVGWSGPQGGLPPPPGMPHPPSMQPPGPGGGYSQPVSPLGRSAKIDPMQMPRPNRGRDSPHIFETRVEGRHAVPPPCSSNYVVRDMGNASPRAMRMTLNYIPCSSDLQKTCCMPLAVFIQPLALPHPDDDPLQVVDFGEEGPPRCTRCKAYISPFVSFTEGGRKFVCPFCSASNVTPESYYCPLGPDGHRTDTAERPELLKGSVEFVATQQFMVRDPMPPVHLFLIDVSYAAVSSGATAAACASIARVLDDLPGGSRARVGVATYDAQIQFYSLQAGQSQPQMLVVPDVAAPYCPLPQSLIVPAQESRALVEQLLEAIPRMFGGTQVAESCGGAAIQAALEVLKGGVGGKLQVFVGSLAKVGANALKLRDASAAGDRDALTVMAPQAKAYPALAKDAAEHQISIDVFVLAQGYVDVATLGALAHHTAGQLYCYTPFAAATDADQLWNDLRWNIIRPQGMEAVARLRVSAGLEVEACSGAFHRRTATDMDLPSINSDQALLVKLRHEDRLQDSAQAFLQFALLYTTTAGERRIRLHTLGLPTTSVLGTVFRGADLDAQFAYVARKVAGQLPASSLAACREAVTRQCVDVLHVYRKFCATASNAGQLILPEMLKLLPLYALALEKSAAYRTETKHDERAAWLSRWDSMPCPRAVPAVYPRLIPLHTLLAQPPPIDGGAAPAYDVLPLSAEKVDAEGVYLLENGFDALLHFGKAADPELVQALLGAEAVQAATLPRLANPQSGALHALLDELRRERGAYMRLRILRRGDPQEAVFFNMLAEDRSPAGMSYVEYLCSVHRQIQAKFT